jgi:large subunit ribosomal protein L10
MNAKEQKTAMVEEIRGKFEKSSSAILVDYIGLTVEQATQLRAQFREAGVEYKVYKNTLTERAIDGMGYDELKPFLKGPTAIAFGGEDPIAPAKILAKAIKEMKKMEMKAGVVDSKVIDAAGAIALSTLPSKEELIAKMLGSMNAPISNFVGVLNGTLRALVYALNAVVEQKQA